MRKEVDRIITNMAEKDPSIVVVVADLGKFEVFREHFPERFYNVGVAEQNSAGIAAGLASEGKKVFLFSVAGFTLYRAFEQLKFSVGYWSQPVCLFATGFGWRYHRIGRGHHAPDDIALVRTIPNMRILTPADSSSLQSMLADEPRGPLYIRLGENIEVDEYGSLPGTGKDLIILAPGEMAKRCHSAASTLRNRGVDVGLVSIEHLSIRKIQIALEGAEQTARIMVVEDHMRMGGLGSMAREAGFSIDMHLYLPVNVEAVTETVEELLEYYGLDERSLVRSATDLLEKSK
jgi:transketolase